ncbi:MAG: hypothetical protein MJZ32_03410 [Bacteroidaceae bacterium]|nr:hypothetical protein [Bacteroidaceae bacterium]
MNLRYLTELALLLIATAAMAQQKMTVHLNNGQQITYNISDVKYVEIEAESSTDNPAADGVGGVVGDPVDLGLSVKWASHNLGATLTSDDGGRFTWADAGSNAIKWGDGWRLPTNEEWEELYQNCRWSWEVRDGVGGRVITGPSGRSIFIPATGVSFDNKVQIRGCIGIYWTAADAQSLPGVPASAVGAYFDSANIYRMEYPCTNTFSVRLVK